MRTKQTNPASYTHPLSGEKVWFNQAHLFHVSALKNEIANSLINFLGRENLPRNTYFGDGGEIDVEQLQLIRDLYEQQQISFDWQKNDLLLLDNMYFTHGRNPFKGNRKVLVGMSRPCSVADCS